MPRAKTGKFGRGSGVLRTATLIAVLASTATLLASCTSLLGMNDYHDSVSELCDLLERCYDEKDCENRIGSSLAAAPANDRAAWLSAVTAKDCLAQCSKARKCLNIAPICSQVGTPCTDKLECCGFLTGGSDCRPPVSASGEPAPDGGSPDGGSNPDPDAGTSGAASLCCFADGAPCDDTSANHQCCAGFCRNGRCAGIACRPEGEACQDGFQCCTGVCRDDVCAEDICVDLGYSCIPTTDTCCDGECSARGICEYPQQCRPLQEPCVPGEPIDTPKGCCANDPTSGELLECKPLDASSVDSTDPAAMSGVCIVKGTSVCAPLGSDCSSLECCAGLNCNQAYKKCGSACFTADAPCQFAEDCCSGSCGTQKPGQCDCSNTYCTPTLADPSGGCCDVAGKPAKCYGGVCLASCGTVGCSHDECIEGAPMDASACQLDPKKADPTGLQANKPSAVVTAVCDDDPYCCCNEWDAICVTAAVSKFGVDVCK